MLLVATSAARHLAAGIQMRMLASTIKTFSDGELFVRIDEDVHGRDVWVVAATQAPAEHLLELFFLLDALQRAGARIHLFITYFAYARQVVAAPGEACSAQVIGNILRTFTITKTYILHPHSELLHTFMPFTAVRDIDFFCKQAIGIDAIAAPDKGAYALAREVAQICGKELILLTKRRPDHDIAEIVAVEGSVAHKKILLVDDIISTGRTLVESAQALINLGAVSVAAAATHGVFAADARTRVEQSSLTAISVTNSIDQQAEGKIQVVNISGYIESVMNSYIR